MKHLGAPSLGDCQFRRFVYARCLGCIAAAKVGIEIDEALIPLREDVRGACEILAFDPLYVANEGRFVMFVAEKDGDRSLEIIRSYSPHNGVVIGKVTDNNNSLVTLKNTIGSQRILDMLSGEQLPRIC